ncbi:MAG TPA: Gfo/Idh/MocA family oxidoreductase [Streptosporangiaceae bacterium]|nr:Gfo/Idh/MocA family oxidoreductase [Streptosporangiaceae bacterium]
MTSPPLRFGLVGTGYWARIAHAPVLASTEGIELAAVWGRNPRAAAELAAGYHATTPHEDLAAFLDAVDGVAFAVPPDVQTPIATRAARAGKHLLLEKPIALSEADADELAEAAEQNRVASVVFFTLRFQPQMRAWLADVTAGGGWRGGVAAWFGSSLLESSPFNTPWRREKGALWDLGPHVVSLLWAVLGPVTSVTADAGPEDVAHLVLHHQGGPSSVVTVTQSAGEAARGFEAYIWGASGQSDAPTPPDDPAVPLRIALTELAQNARSGRTRHSCDVRFGREVGRVLAAAQRQLDERAAR